MLILRAAAQIALGGAQGRGGEGHRGVLRVARISQLIGGRAGMGTQTSKAEPVFLQK